MYSLVNFLTDTRTYTLPDELKDKDVVVTYRDGFGYELPKIDGAKYIEFEMFKIQYVDLNPDVIVFVGLNRIITPTNRCDFVFEYLYGNSPQVVKISVDNAPFLGEPWRLWFHYGLCFGKWLDVTYSYIVETDWQHWFYQDSDSSMISSENIADKIDRTYSDLHPKNLKINFYDARDVDIEYYDIVKESAFSKYGNPKQIILFMRKELNKHFGIEFDYDSYMSRKEISVPSFGVYRFIAEENMRRLSIYNIFACH